MFGVKELSLSAKAGETLRQPFANGERELIAYPQKRPLLRITTRPPHLETPFSVFNEGAITPNDAFFVRYHLANIPLAVDPASFRLKSAAESPPNCRYRSRTCRPWAHPPRSLPSINARATVEDSCRPGFSARNSATARWATRAGSAFR